MRACGVDCTPSRRITSGPRYSPRSSRIRSRVSAGVGTWAIPRSSPAMSWTRTRTPTVPESCQRFQLVSSGENGHVMEGQSARTRTGRGPDGRSDVHGVVKSGLDVSPMRTETLGAAEPPRDGRRLPALPRIPATPRRGGRRGRPSTGTSGMWRVVHLRSAPGLVDVARVLEDAAEAEPAKCCHRSLFSRVGSHVPQEPLHVGDG
jgi:hypothetical protein